MACQQPLQEKCDTFTSLTSRQSPLDARIRSLHSSPESSLAFETKLTSPNHQVDADKPARDPEKAVAAQEDKNIIDWDGTDDPEHPQNWSSKRKWAALFTVSCFAFISPVSSSMIAPSLHQISSDFSISSSVIAQMTLSIFILAYAVGPMFLGPLSEIYGRVVVLQLANLFYLSLNLGCGFAQTKGQMIAFRFLSGLGGSAPMAVAGGVVTDLFDHADRGKAVSIYTLAPLLGPAVGPIIGGFITENTTWRWVFWATCVADAVIQVAGLIFLQETYAPLLLRRKCCHHIKQTGNKSLHTKFDSAAGVPVLTKLRQNLVRPFRMLSTQIIIQFLSIYMAYLYGLMYIVLSTFTTLWTDVYHERLGIGSLNYIALGLGFFIAAQITPRVSDRMYKKFMSNNDGVKAAEFRVPPMWVGSTLVPTGLLIYGWTAHNHMHWIGPDIGIFVFATGVIICFQSTQIYLVDAYTRYAASALGAVNTLRSLAGFGFPLFAPRMYDVLGYGWGNTLLALAAVVVGMPVPWVLWRYGAKLRAMSGYAAG